MAKLGLQSKMFSDKVTLLEQSGSRVLSLTSSEARNLHNEIVGLLARIVELENPNETDKKEDAVMWIGGKF